MHVFIGRGHSPTPRPGAILDPLLMVRSELQLQGCFKIGKGDPLSNLVGGVEGVGYTGNTELQGNCLTYVVQQLSLPGRFERNMDPGQRSAHQTFPLKQEGQSNLPMLVTVHCSSMV